MATQDATPATPETNDPRGRLNSPSELTVDLEDAASMLAAIVELARDMGLDEGARHVAIDALARMAHGKVDRVQFELGGPCHGMFTEEFAAMGNLHRPSPPDA